MPTSKQHIDGMRDALLALVAELEKEDEGHPAVITDNDPIWTVLSYGTEGRFCRRRETKAAAANLEGKFFRRPWTDKWSRRFIDAVMGSAIAAGLNDPRPPVVRHWMEKAVEELDQAPPRSRIIFAVSGITAAEEIQFGASVLFPMTETKAEDLVERFAKVISGMRDPEALKEANLERTKQTIDRLRGAACLEIELPGDDDKVIRDAPIVAEAVVDFLQLVASINEPHVVNVSANAVTATVPPVLLLSGNGRVAHWQDHWSSRKAVVSHSVIAQFRSAGFGALIESVGKPDLALSEYERLLITSMHWIGHGDKQIYPEHQITSFITGIELFFSTDNETPISRDVSEGVAILLRPNIEQRRALYKAMREFYTLRNKATHAGDRSATQDKATHLKVIAINFLAEMSKRSDTFRTRGGLSKWIADLRLAVDLSEGT